MSIQVIAQRIREKVVVEVGYSGWAHTAAGCTTCIPQCICGTEFREGRSDPLLGRSVGSAAKGVGKRREVGPDGVRRSVRRTDGRIRVDRPPGGRV